MIGVPGPLVRPLVTPQSDLRGAAGASFGGQVKDPGSGQGGLQAREARTQTPGPVQPPPGSRPNGLLAIGMEGIEALQGIKSGTSDEKAGKEPGPGELTGEEEALVRELSRTDQEVRRHEQAHAAAGGAHAGAPSYTFEQGPDGKRYAVGGEVPIDTSPVKGDPDATVRKMRQVKAAALAPATPSGQDRSVAAAADAISQQAETELRTQRIEEIAGAEDVKEGEQSEETLKTSPAPGSGESGRSGASPSTPPRDIPPGSFADISV